MLEKTCIKVIRYRVALIKRLLVDPIFAEEEVVGKLNEALKSLPYLWMPLGGRVSRSLLAGSVRLVRIGITGAEMQFAAAVPSTVVQGNTRVHTGYYLPNVRSLDGSFIHSPKSPSCPSVTEERFGRSVRSLNLARLAS